jgi:hypothetical protein
MGIEISRILKYCKDRDLSPLLLALPLLSQFFHNIISLTQLAATLPSPSQLRPELSSFDKPSTDMKIQHFLLSSIAALVAHASPARRDCGETKTFTATNACGMPYGG